MKRSCDHLSPVSSDFFQLINIYNNQETTADVKTQSLEKINIIVHNFLKEASSSQKDAQEIKEGLKQVKVQSHDIHLWNQLVGEIENVSPTSSDSPQLFIEGFIRLLPDEVFLLIVEELKLVDIGSLFQTKHHFYSFLSDPKQLTHFLDKFSFQLSPEKRFYLALRCGKELTKLDLSDFQGLDNEQLEMLQKSCPNLQSLNLSYISRESLDFSILRSFSKLEALDLSGTKIKTLDALPNSLKELNLDECRSLTTKELQKLNNDSFLKLEKLNVSGTLIAALDQLPKSLKELDLRFCPNLTAQAFQKLNDSFSKLEKLNVIGTQIATLGQLPKSLKMLDLINCRNLTNEEKKKLASFAKLARVNDL